MTANSFIAVEGRSSMHQFRHCLLGYWGISAGSRILSVAEVVGLALLPRFPHTLSTLGGLISTLAGMNRNYKKIG